MNVIRVDHVEWNVRHLEQLLITIKANPRINSLHLSGMGIFDLDLEKLWIALWNCPCLDKLSIRRTSMSKLKDKKFMSYLACDRLKVLKLNHIDDLFLNLDMDVLIGLKNIRTLDISANDFTDTFDIILNLINNSNISTFILYGLCSVKYDEYLERHFNRLSPVSILLFYKHDIYTSSYTRYEQLLKKYPQIIRVAKHFHSNRSELEKLQNRNYDNSAIVSNYKHDIKYTLIDLYTRGDPRKITSHRPILEIIARKTQQYSYLELVELLCSKSPNQPDSYDSPYWSQVIILIGFIFLLISLLGGNKKSK